MSAHAADAPPLSTWRHVRRLVRGQLGLQLAFASMIVLFYGLPLVPGLTVRWFLDALASGEPAGWSLWSARCWRARVLPSPARWSWAPALT